MAPDLMSAENMSSHEFIRALPRGYDTPLGTGGGTLSGGQRQLVSFARAVLADPRILIFDEATSNTDTRTEALIQEALGTRMMGRTSVVLAHRLITIRNADLILVVASGRIAERGTTPRCWLRAVSTPTSTAASSACRPQQQAAEGAPGGRRRW